MNIPLLSNNGWSSLPSLGSNLLFGIGTLEIEWNETKFSEFERFKEFLSSSKDEKIELKSAVLDGKWEPDDKEVLGDINEDELWPCSDPLAVIISSWDSWNILFPLPNIRDSLRLDFNRRLSYTGELLFDPELLLDMLDDVGDAVLSMGRWEENMEDRYEEEEEEEEEGEEAEVETEADEEFDDIEELGEEEVSR